MIINMYYNKGRQTIDFLSHLFGPKHLINDDEYSKPHWVIHWRFDKGVIEDQHAILNTWLHDNCTGSYDSRYRFNSGDPYLEINIYNNDDMTTFRLRWDDRHERN